MFVLNNLPELKELISDLISGFEWTEKTITDLYC